MQLIRLSLLVLSGLVFTAYAAAQPVAAANATQPRRGDLQEDKKIAEANGWIWTGADFSNGFEQARKTGMPLMIVLRCPP